MKPQDGDGKPPPRQPLPEPRRREPRASTPPASTEPRVVVNASLLDDVELNAELPAGVEVWTPGGVRPPKASIPAKVDLWVPDGIKGPQPGTRRPPGPPPFRAQQATMLLPVATRRHRHKRFAALSVAAFVAALAMLAGVLGWRHWSKSPAPVREELTCAAFPDMPDKSDVG